MAKLWQRTRTAEGKSKLVENDLATLRVDRPSVIFLCGFMTTDSQSGFIAGALKRLEEVMHARPGDKAPVDLYAWSHTNLANVFNLAAYNLRPESRYCKAAQNLAAGVIMPLVAQGFSVDAQGRASGTPLPADDVRRNLRNITFLGYSAGTIVAQECFNASLKMMRDIGYDAAAARDLLQEVALIATGNVSRPSREKDRFTTLYLVASNDKLIRAKNRIWRPLKTLFARFSRHLNIKKLSATSAFISAAVTRRKWEWRDGKNGQQEKTRIGQLIPMIRSYHELPHYMTHDEQLSQFAKIVQYGLANAVRREGKSDPIDLIIPPAGTPQDEAAKFRDKINRAMVDDSVRI